MTIRIEQLPWNERLKFSLLSRSDQKNILDCKNVEEALNLLSKKKENIRFNVGNYEPKLQVSGSAVKYKTKNLFTEIFDEQDVKDFMMLAEISAVTEDEIIIGELKRKMNTMMRSGRQPLQCMVYSTKNNEKVFYNNDKKVTVWAKVIAEMVNSNIEYVLSINHMLVNWSIWRFQIILLIKACEYIKQNEKLDEVIRDLYIDNEDDRVKYTVIKRLLHGQNIDNYRSAFLIIRDSDFISADTDRKYFNALKRKVENAICEEREKLYAAFRGTQGLSGVKRKRIESLFVEREESGIVKKINESNPSQKDAILKEVHGKIYGSQKDYREIADQTRNIKMYRDEIQKMFMEKLDKTRVGLEDIKFYGLAIGNLDLHGKAIPFLEEQMSMRTDESEQVMFGYVLAIISDSYIDNFIERILQYNGNNVHSLLNSVRNLNRQGKNQVVRQYLYINCIKIKDKYGMDSVQFKTALRNIGEFLQGGHTVAVYDVKFDQLLFQFLGYNKTDGSIEKMKCTARNTALVLGILENVMDKNNYEGRYMNIMWDLFAYFKNTNIDLANRIDHIVKGLTGQGIPSM